MRRTEGGFGLIAPRVSCPRWRLYVQAHGLAMSETRLPTTLPDGVMGLNE